MLDATGGDIPFMDSWDREQLLGAIEGSLGHGLTITYAHCETVRRSLRDPEYLATIESLDHCFIDGVGAQIAALIARGRWMSRTTSDDFVRDLWVMAARHRLRVALVGGHGGVARRSAGILAASAEVDPVLVADGQLGPDGEEGLAACIAASRPDLVLLGLGQPLQERVAIHLARRCPNAIVVCVGGMFDWLRDGPCRPMWSRKVGLEWMFRLAQEPRRLWRRYLLGPPETLARIAAAKFRVPVAKGSPAPEAMPATPRTSRSPTAPARACR